jgi:hypothetical protein
MTYADVALRLPSASARWRSPAFREELRAWVSEEVGEPTSLEPVKIRAWASVWRAETPAGVQFAKQNCVTQPFEAALLSRLNELAPRHVVPLTTVDLERGLLMTPDQGPVMAAASNDDVDAWCRVVAAGAALQREVMPYVDRIAATGLDTLAPGDAVGYVERLLDVFARIPEDDPRAMPAERRAAVRAHLPVVGRWAEQVSALGLPTTLCHNDLHGNNVFDRDGELRFFDFGDALLMEPLAVLMIPLRMLADQVGAGPDDRRLWRVAEAALEVWSDLAPATELRAALPAALQLAVLGRTETWVRCQAPMDDTELAEWGGSAAASLDLLLAPPPLGHLPG